jgi:16S rRNA (guanine527-N7)-methyltransferase
MEQILFDLLRSWPGVLGRPDPALVEDCLVLLPLLGGALTLIDVGSGGGLPGLPLKLARPELEVTLLEANRRKAAFLVQASAQLELGGVRVLAERAEVAAHEPREREAYDVATARAVAPLPVLAELCLPFVRVGGRLLAMKASLEGELEAAGGAIELLGGAPAEVHAAPSAARRRGSVVVIRKVAPTPGAYPRRPGVPGRRPLGSL